MTYDPIRPEEHLGLVRHVVRRRDDDELADAVLVLVRTAADWNAGRAPAGVGWSTLVRNRIVWSRLTAWRTPAAKSRAAEVPLFLPGKNEDDEVERHEMAVEDPAPRQAEAQRDALALLAGLEERERFVLERRFGIRGEAATREQIGREMGVTREAVRQVERKAIAKLRKRARVHRHVDTQAR